ncbi:hypothetical protein V1264_016475 [Littorina saxatilis]|uniref:Mutator-like transposase domain-containing protein n=1 Tax=Littorina saxatilis TaxID=31220 RepID=A0AAN9BP62_9CAEN
MARKKRATKSTVKHGACSKSKVSHIEKMRLAKKALVEKPEIGESCEAEMEHVYEGVEHDLHAEVEEIIAQPASASASKLNCYRQSFPVVDEEDQLVFRHRNWCLMEIGQLNQLLSDLKCPTCDASVEVTLGEKSGLSRKMKLRCTTDGCNYSAENHTSPRLYNGTRVCQAFDVNHRSVLYSVQTGGGFAALDTFCAIFGMPNMFENAYQRLHKTVCTASVQTCELTLANCRSIVRDNNQEMNPGYVHDENTPEPEDCWDIDDGVPWADVAFDGTWQRRGYVSHYGVGLVVEMLTGYVLDFHVMSTYCLACKIKEKEGLPQDEWDAWMEGHRKNCQQNHHASAKAMERDAALKLWTESVERTGLRYRTMLSDGDSTAFRAVEESAPYGERRKVTKLECVNHVHKRMGTTLRKQAQENRLGGRGQGRLTAEKCRRLQDYYRGAILSNVDKTEDNMRNAIWGTWFHCTSTDEAPRHNRCPAGHGAFTRGRWPRVSSQGLMRTT